MSTVIPPELKPDECYKSWKAKVRLWQQCTSLAKEKQAPSIALALQGAASDVALKIPIETLAKDDGVDALILKLDSLFKEDEDQMTFNTYDTLECFRRSADMSMTQYMVKFDVLYQRAKAYGNQLTQPVLAYRLLKGANLTQDKEQLARATCTKWDYETLKIQLKKIYDEQAANTLSVEGAVGGTEESNVNIKQEPVDESNVYYTKYRGNRNKYGENSKNIYKKDSGFHKESKLNPIVNGQRLKCIICKSIYHLIKDCEHRDPDKYYKGNKNSRESYLVEEYDDENEEEEVYVTLLASSLLNTNKMVDDTEDCYVTSFVGECLGVCILDSGCPKNVAGEGWSDAYIESLSREDQKKVIASKGNTKFRFGDERVFECKEKLKVPARIGGKLIMIEYSVIPTEIPLLLSKEAMKKAKTTIDFDNDVIQMFGKKQKILYTKSGHYAIALNDHMRAIKDEDIKVVLLNVEEFKRKSDKEKQRIAVKLHKQFAHPRSERLKKLIKDSGVDDEYLNKSIDKVGIECQICTKYKRQAERPVVSFSLARNFNELVSMDLKFFKNKIILHLCDVATRFSRACVIPSKRTTVVVTAIMQLWISLFGPPCQMLSDNGGEFGSDELREMGENLNVTILSTAAEAPWSNGINERHNGILGEMLNKLTAEKEVSIEIALAWAVSAKNALTNIYGYSPNQLLFGTNPNLPNILNSNLPAIEEFKRRADIDQEVSSTDSMLNKLQCIASARKAFISAESSGKLSKAILSKVRTSTALVYEVGQSVYYKRNNIDRWKGPARIIGKDGKNIVVRHQASVCSVSPCRLVHEHRYKQEFDVKGTEDTHLESEEKTEATENVEDKEDEGNTDEKIEEIHEISDNEDSHATDQVKPRKRGRPRKPSKQIPEEIETPKIKTCIRYKLKGKDEWKVADVLSKLKQTGKHKYYINVYNKESKDTACINFESDVDEWEEVATIEEVLYGNILDTSPVKAAQLEELEKWKKYNVYKTVPDTGQKYTSVRWVVTQKGEKTKARLVARGYEESWNEGARKDSPTCSRGGQRIAKSIISSKQWPIKSLDVQAAFLQGEKVEREIFLKPPPEANETGLWRLEKCVYGLQDASRSWYLRVVKEIEKLKLKKCKYDEAIFSWYNENELAGIIVAHVDDFMWAGNAKFEDEVIEKLRKVFKISKEDSEHFKYLGLNIKQRQDGIEVDQIAYNDAIKEFKIESGRDRNEDASKEEKKAFRSVVGQLQWATQTRPDICFQVCQASVAHASAKVKDLYEINKTIRKLRKEMVMKFPNLGDLKGCKILCFTDAALYNLKDQGSQIGYIIFLANDEGRINPLMWKSVKARRVVRSTISVECLALAEGANVSFYLRSVLQELLRLKENEIPIEMYTDNKSLVDSIYSTHTVADSRLLVDIAEIRSKLELGEISKVTWVESKSQLADAMTKAGADAAKLVEVLEKATIHV